MRQRDEQFRTGGAEDFAGTLPVGGSKLFSFTVTASGTVNVTLNSLGGAFVPSTVQVALAKSPELAHVRLATVTIDPLHDTPAVLKKHAQTLKANPAAIDNVDEFKKTMDTFSAANPYLKDPNAKLKYVGMTSFGQKRQVAVPMVVNEYKDGAFQTLFVGTVD